RVFSPRALPLGQPLCPMDGEGQVGPGPQLGRWLKERGRTICSDHAGFYGWNTMRDLAMGIALAAPLANTSMDHNFRNWWQEDVRSTGTDDLAAFWKPFGEGVIFIPAMACLGLAGHAMSDWPMFDVCGEFGERATRSYLVGAPPMLLMQAMLGASRPGETTAESRWKPFDDNNAVSGHAFIGAVPFLTAAHMTENRAARALFYFGSICPAWSRVNDDAHYLSQVVLGWYMAYLACRSVDGTQRGEEPLSLVPLAYHEFTGVGLVWCR
ncbi:MAG: phosphatase PAP2 family protein, partial [Patescibacteria group bacterium]|nr:phosphatase PAP2 family protein [Patescibacteria group bacterium]